MKAFKFILGILCIFMALSSIVVAIGGFSGIKGYPKPNLIITIGLFVSFSLLAFTLFKSSYSKNDSSDKGVWTKILWVLLRIGVFIGVWLGIGVIGILIGNHSISMLFSLLGFVLGGVCAYNVQIPKSLDRKRPTDKITESNPLDKKKAESVDLGETKQDDLVIYDKIDIDL